MAQLCDERHPSVTFVAIFQLSVILISIVGHCHEPSIGNQDNNNNNNNNSEFKSSQYHHDSDKLWCHSSSSLGYLFSQANSSSSSSTSHQLQQQQQPQRDMNQVDLLLSEVLDRIGPDMRPTSGFKESADLSVELSKRAWSLMQRHAESAANERFLYLWPVVEQLLLDSNVSQKCLRAAQLTAQSARRLDSWAIQLLNSWGQFPAAGLFEGTLGDIGSFHGCINVAQNEMIQHAHYCSISYKPVMPHRADYELLVKREPSELLRLFQNSSTFHQLIKKAQYNHYVYYKMGTCFPIACSPFDVQRVAKLLGKRSILMSGPVKCISKYPDDYEQSSSSSSDNNNNNKLILSSKDLNNGVYIWKPHMTPSQLVALIIVALLVCIILTLSCAHLVLDLWSLFNENQSATTEQRQVNHLSTTSATTTTTRTQNYQLNEIKLLQDNKSDPSHQDTNNNSNGAHHHHHHHHHQQELDDEEQSCKSSQMAHSELITLAKNQSLAHKDQQSTLTSRTPTRPAEKNQTTSLVRALINDCSIITNTREFFLIGISQHKNDILCINGLRCITMSWIIVAHTMQYNDWSAFARIYEIETHLESLINQPLFNASYLVDTFFLISGLLTSFSAFKTINLDSTDDDGPIDDDNNNNNNNNDETPMRLPNKHYKKRNKHGHRTIRQVLSQFSCKTYLIGRYLRLTPQILLVSLFFIILPLLSRTGGPHWYTMTGEYSENCSNNWWINLLHIQAFYKSNEMCNFVCWWISVDMFYHLFALLAILIIFKYGHKMSLRLCSALMLSTGLWQANKHYSMKLPPNLLSTIPQTGAMWSEMTLKYFWCPEAHTFPFIFGFYVGYLMAQRESDLKCWFNLRRALMGWLATILAFICVSYGTYFWVIGKYTYTNEISTLFNIITQIIWSLCLAWVIVACQFNYGGFINQILSCKLFIILGKASYIVYLSHFLLLFSFFGSQNLLLEPTQILMLYVVIGNVCLSMIFGSILCIFFEMPWLKIQKRIMRHI